MGSLVKIAGSDSASMSIDKGVDFASLSFQLPNVDNVAVSIAHPSRNVKEPGNTIEVSPMGITFSLAEDLSNYEYFVNWLFATATDSSQKKNIEIIIFDAANKPIKTISIKDTFPIAISGLSYANTDTNDVVFSVDFDVYDFAIN